MPVETREPMFLAEFHTTQLVAEPVLREGAAVPGGAGQGLVLAHRPGVREQADGAGVPTAAPTRRPLLQNAVRRSLHQVPNSRPNTAVVSDCDTIAGCWGPV